MAVNIVNLRAAIENRIIAMTDYLGDDNTQWENFVFNPVANQAYQVCNMLLTDPRNPEQGPYVQQQGYYQITLRYPASPGSQGSGLANAQAQKIRDWFSYGLSLVQNDTTVQIVRTPTVSPGATEGDRYSVPVKIFFNAY